jgi:hypothetical protein
MSIKHLVLFQPFLLLLCCTSCQSLRSHGKKGQKWEETMMSNYVARSVQYSLNSRNEFDAPICIDTNLVFRDNVYSGGKKVFNWIPKPCDIFGNIDLSEKRGTLKIPDSLAEKVYFVNDSFDFDRDSFEFILLSMPVYVPKYQLYIFRSFHSDQTPFNRYLWAEIVCLNQKGEFVDCPCNGLGYYPLGITSEYWSRKLSPHPCGEPCRERQKRIGELMDKGKL